jgi:isocitrate lyase
MSNSTLKPVEPSVSTALPGDSFQLLPEASKAGQAEDALFEEQVQAVKDWWASPRYKGIKRPYSAEDVVSKRGALQQSYPSSLMARKLFNLLEERAAKGEPVHTSAFTLVYIDRTMADYVFISQWAQLIPYKCPSKLQTKKSSTSQDGHAHPS